MEIASRKTGNCLVVDVLTPQIDYTVSEVFKEKLVALINTSDSNILLNLQKVDFMDSKAIGAMVGIRKKARARGVSFGLCCLHPFVAKIIRVVTLDTIFDTFLTEREGVAQLGGAEA